jgi:hypothetical protein
MSKLLDRIKRLEAMKSSNPPRMEADPDLAAAVRWMVQNNCPEDLLPHPDMTEGERAALLVVLGLANSV